MRRRLLCALSVLAIEMLSAGAFAHGGVSIDQDICLMKLGPYRSHFTGYLPEKRSTQEFCEDIPEVGTVIMVMDFISDELRPMQTDFRIIRDVKKIGRSAQLQDLGTPDDIMKATVYYKPPSEYPHGTLSATYQFAQEGLFVGIVTATGTDGTQHVSVFPFAVGQKSYWRYLVIMLLAVAAATGLYRYAARG